MSAGDFIIIALLFVLCAIPGAITSIKIADKEWLSLKASVAGALVLSSVCLFFVSAFVYSSETRGIIYAVVPFLGFANGWVYPAQRNLLVALIPGGSEAEMYASGVLRGDGVGLRARHRRATPAQDGLLPVLRDVALVGALAGLPRYG